MSDIKPNEKDTPDSYTDTSSGLQDSRSLVSAVRTVGVAIGIGIVGYMLVAITALFVGIIGFVAGIPKLGVYTAGIVVGQYVGFAGLALGYLGYRFGWNGLKSYLGIRKPTATEVRFVFFTWVALCVGLILTSPFIESEMPDSAVQDMLVSNPWIIPAIIVLMFLVVGPCEEVLYRGVVQGRLRERLSAVPAVGIASLFFAHLHMPSYAVLFAESVGTAAFVFTNVTVVAVALGWLYERTRNIVVVSLFHSSYNSMVVLFIYFDELYDLSELVFVLFFQ